MHGNKMVKTLIAASALVAPLALHAPAALGQPGKGGPPGHADRAGAQGKAQGRGPGGYGPPGQLRKGDRVQGDYRDREYVIDDWRSYGLPPPRRGHHWVGIAGEYYLVATPTGVVVQVGSGR
ncbi:RcnB family protein [Cupriavidus respiraculi]|uniref:RcnB family protein n=1 Tax=Cupriavidus respiraculi TaxID=195930 RepID=UPI001C979FBC|nr:RcnB family protein [Cupriavidus respiraculi]MBY4947539.1 RcnB family protein [Cupriavidus respiraculi]